MVAERSFIIDATFLLDDAEKAFFGSAPLVDVGDRNTSVAYGAVRDMLRLRRTLGIARGSVVVGADADEVSSAVNLKIFVECLLGIGTNVLREPSVRVAAICRSMLRGRKATWIVTRNKSLMQLVNCRCGVILASEGAPPEVTTEDTLAAHHQIRPEQVPSFLALTDAGFTEAFTTKQAARLLEVCGSLNAAFDATFADAISPKMRRFLLANKAQLLTRLQDLTAIDHIHPRWTIPMGPIVRCDQECRRVFKNYGFPSLGRLLEPPRKVELLRTAPDTNHAYLAVVDRAGLSEFEKAVTSAEVCAVDTESTDKDPRKASLLGVAIAITEGQAFYVPVTETDLRDVSTASIIDVLRRLLGSHVKVVGHNLKYDYVLLRRYGIRINVLHFDTMLAAHECFGDLDFFNLGAVAKKLIGKDVKRYRDLVDKGETLQEIPFKHLVEHGCADADAALRLYGCLREILRQKGIDSQFANDVMPLIQLLGDKELDGVRVNIRSIARTKNALASQAECSKAFIFAKNGKQFNIDSMKNIATVFRANEGLRERIGRQPLREGQLEQLAQGNELAHAIVQYRRLQKRIGQLEEICRQERNGKVFPLFSQVKAPHGSISSVDPRLLEHEGVLPPGAVLDKDIRQCMPNASRTLDILQDLTGDRMLQKDRQAHKNDFMGGGEPSLMGLCHTEVLVSLLIGVSNAALCKKFLIDARRARVLREVVTSKYPRLFAWIEERRRNIVSSGFASSGERRRYWEGLGSSDIDRRHRALRGAVRWLIGM
jgi:DNA polymerase I-like protein with 3'-5' exonuclease and polymerase domains